jgi:hypothetical protein
VSIKTIVVIIVVIALAGAGWLFRDSDMVRGATSTAKTFVKDALPDNSYTAGKANAEKATGKTDPSKAAHMLRKCVSDASITYTDEKCPPGTREAPISEGNVTVMPGQRAGAQAKGGEKAR